MGIKKMENSTNEEDDTTESVTFATIVATTKEPYTLSFANNGEIGGLIDRKSPVIIEEAIIDYFVDSTRTPNYDQISEFSNGSTGKVDNSSIISQNSNTPILMEKTTIDRNVEDTTISVGGMPSLEQKTAFTHKFGPAKYMTRRTVIVGETTINENKLGLSCAKLSSSWVS